ncbi:WD40 repeat domain-containing protein [Frigoriglobus tundricola]|uniref:Uncharacterized protein n=1 Tax=Frigoriglobus tundricola TaxID=2774151 RepID=A0A6M5YUE0_9BACT|nr:hypothetical protein [Frigoriglobus tundricola]QJW96861.1 hypothetical protein FTUN_4421 [Frigoriglobus tundricola]
MAVRLVCRACGKRLKLPNGAGQKRSAKCPKCLTPVDLTAALEASAYLPTIAIAAPVRDAQRQQSSRPHGDAPLPSPIPQPLPKSPSLPSPPAPPLSKSAPAAPLSERASPPPGSPAHATSVPPTPFPGEILSLDDDEPTGPAAEPDPPFRVPVRVLTDSLRQIVGPCFAVLVPHGLFLEHEPMKPFLYAPVGCAVGTLGAGELALTLPDGRAVTLQFETRPLARDTRAFLAGERPVPVAADHRRKWWLLWAALIFALGLAGGPIVLAHAADLGSEFGLRAGVGFALLGLAGNAAVVLLSRGSVPAQLGVMAGVCAAVTGLFLFGAAAYLAGRHRGTEEVKADPPPAPVPAAPNVPPPPEPPPPDPSPARPPTHLDRAKKSGSSALEDGPADVTALELAPDHNTLAIGYADGTTRLWPLDQATFDAVLPGPKAEGPVTRVQFDTKNRFVFAHSATGVVAAPRNGPALAVAKLPGFPVAVAPEPDADRLRFAAVRGNTLQLRLISTTFVQSPKGRDRGYVLPGKGDETLPMGLGKDPAKPAATFFAWAPGGKLMAGQPDGSILLWSGPLRPEAASRDHKATVKAWATCPATGDFATGDEQGHVGIWSAMGGKPTLTSVLATPITGLSFNATGSRLVVTDTTGWLVIWDVSAAKALHRVKRPAAIRAMTAGPTDDVVLLAVGKTVEVWWVSELVK